MTEKSNLEVIVSNLRSEKETLEKDIVNVRVTLRDLDNALANA